LDLLYAYRAFSCHPFGKSDHNLILPISTHPPAAMCDQKCFEIVKENLKGFLQPIDWNAL